jgi:hypothetical protein
MNSKNYLGLTSIDSLKLSFNTDEVDIINPKLLDHFQKAKINKTTGEVELGQDIQLNSLIHEYDNYHIHFQIAKVFNQIDSSKKDERIIVLANSKLLEQNYMQGISMKNIELVYNKIMEAKVFHISFEDFLSKCIVSDIDVKKDSTFESTDEFDKVVKTLDNATVPDKRRNYGSNPFNLKHNKGIEWNSRSTSTFTHPFLKIYHKGIESKHGKNLLFFATHLNVESIKQVVRIEATIKNFSEHGKKYKLKDNTLISLLKKTSDELHKVIEHSLLSNLHKRVKEVKQRSINEYSPSDKIFFVALQDAITTKNYSIEMAINYLCQLIDEPVAKSRMKKRLITIYESEIKGEIAEVKARNISGFFDAIGWK